MTSYLHKNRKNWVSEFKGRNRIRMVKKKWDRTSANYILIILFVYFFSHHLLLIASGIWHDDYYLAPRNWNTYYDGSLQGGLPLRAYLLASVWYMPGNLWRVIVFFLYLAGAFLFYGILNKIDCLNKKDSLWIVLLYITAPVNQARNQWVCFDYAIGFFAFWISFYLGALWKEKTGFKRVIIRVLSLVILFFSYDTRSIMSLTICILIFFVYYDLKKEKIEGIFSLLKKTCHTLLLHIDYVLLPFVWFFGDNLLFPKYGSEGNYYSLSGSEIMDALASLPINAFGTFKKILYSYKGEAERDVKSKILVILIIVVCFLIGLKKEYTISGEKRKNNLKKEIGILLTGIVAFMCGFFAYGIMFPRALDNYDFPGRNTLLLGIGVALILYALVCIFFRESMIACVLVPIIVAGALYFNNGYLTYQGGRYEQEMFGQWVRDNDVPDEGTFIVVPQNELRYTYSSDWTGIAWQYTGETTRAFLREYMPSSNEERERKSYSDVSKDYSPVLSEGKPVVDGLFFVDYNDLTRVSILKGKIYELFAKDKYEDWIRGLGIVHYVPLSLEESRKLYSMYDVGDPVEGELLRELYLKKQ